MATRTTYTRSQPAESEASIASSDTTPSALGALGSIVVTEDPAQDGGASVTTRFDAYTWTGVRGVALDPRTQRPFRVAPWVPSTLPTDLLALVTEEPLSAYITAPSTSTYATLSAALAAQLGAWGWTSTEEQV